MLVFDSFGQIGTWRRWKCDPKLSWYESMMGQDQLCKQFRKCHHLGSPTYAVQHMQKETNICFQYNAYSLSLIIYNHLCATVCGCQRVSFGGNSVSRHTEKIENTHLLGPGVKFFSSSNARKNSVSSKIPTLPIPAPDLSWVAYLGLCIFCILPIQTFTFHFPKTNSDPLSRWPVSLWYRNNDVSPKTTGEEVGVWDSQGGATLMVCLTYENYCLILVSHLLNKS